MNIKVEWNKIVVNTLSILVGAIIIGAATIVWKGATSVDAKVKETKEDVTFLIDTLSKKLGKYEIQIESQSNQLVEVSNALKDLNHKMDLADEFHVEIPVMSSAPKRNPPPKISEPEILQMEQMSRGANIQKQLKR